MNFSVLMSVYAQETPSFLRAALKSVQNNSVLPTEIVLVIDGPIGDDLALVIESFSESLPLKITRLERNMGLGNALRTGLLQCSYEWVARFDSDDICVPDRFEKQLNFIDSHPGIDAFSAPIIEFENTIDESNRIFRPVPIGHEDIFEAAKRRNPFNHMSVMFRKSSVLAAGSYQPDHLFEDYSLWVRMLLNGSRFANMIEPVVYARATGMFGRRGGAAYALSELRMQRKFYHWGFISFAELCRNLAVRLPVRLLPSFARKSVYRWFLRART